MKNSTWTKITARTSARLLAAAVLIGSAAALATAHDARAAGTAGSDAAASAAISPGTQITSSDGTPLGTTTSDGSYTALCRTDGGDGTISVGITAPGMAGIAGYIPSTGITGTSDPSGLPDCGTIPADGLSGGGTIPGATDEHCAIGESREALFSEFAKNLINNDANRWWSFLTAAGYPGKTMPPSTSQQVSDALNQISATFYDDSSAFSDALRAMLNNGTDIYTDCTDTTSEPDENAMGNLAEGSSDLYWSNQILSQLASLVADDARNASAQNQGTSHVS